MDYKVELKISADGSSTLYRPDLDEHYHSVNGAIQESVHVFIEAGLKHKKVSPLNILEVGFGTGLNALLTMVHNHSATIYYHALEIFPVDIELTDSINYPKLIGDDEDGNLFKLLHQASWNQEVCIRDDFFLTKLETDLLLFKAENKYDLVYFDAFAPEKQPEMWSNDVFTMLYSAMRNGGVLTTYCAKGVVRRTMQSAGFQVERLKGPPGKWEMLRATK